MALYDALGDVTCTAFLSGDGTQAAATQTIYGLTPFNWTINWTINCDGNLNATTQVRDPAARMLVVKQLATAPGATCTTPASTYDTAYRYDALGRLIFVTDAKGNQTTITYDLAGRKISMQDPDMGHWTYAYDAAGKLTRQTDARGITTTLTYDALGRLLGKSYSDSTPAVQYTYDAYPAGSPCAAGPTAIGHQVQMSDGAGVRQSCFDLRGKEVLTRRTLNADAYSSAATYDIARTYDDAGELLQLTYPDGEVVKYSYTAGAISGLTSATYGSPIIAGAALTPAGTPAALGLGNGATTTYTYDFRQRVSGIATGTTTVADQSLTLTYDAAGNVATQADTRPSGSEQIT
ncbi:MAG: RHS repeat protein, partial [Chloroflexota bacterium]|nr:RHS repeat protein [Chloroflexota bacterium]